MSNAETGYGPSSWGDACDLMKAVNTRREADFMKDEAFRYHIGTVGLPDKFITCVRSVDEVGEFFKDVAKEVEESAAIEHDNTCEDCRPALLRGERPDCLGMDESTDASAALSALADGDALAHLHACGIGGAMTWKIADTTYSVLVTLEFKADACQGNAYNSSKH